MAIALTDLIARVRPDVEGRVKRVRDQERSVLQGSLRSECGLLFRTPEEAEENRAGAQVPVEISAGYPAVLSAVMLPEDIELIMVVSRYRATLEQARNGAVKLLELRQELVKRPNADEWVRANEPDLNATAD